MAIAPVAVATSGDEELGDSRAAADAACLELTELGTIGLARRRWFDEVPAPPGVLPESPYCEIEVWR